MKIEFFVEGIPKPAGSKRALMKNDKIVVFDMSKNRDWKRDVQIIAKKRMNELGMKLFEGPLRMKLTFYMPIPKHLKNKDLLFHTKKPDLTKLIRCVEDAMTGIVYVDDRYICEQICRKYYGNKIGVEVEISKFDNYS